MDEIQESDTAALDGLVIAKVDKIADTKVTVVERFLKVFLATVGIEQEQQPLIIKKFWFKILLVFMITSITCQFMKCFFLDNVREVIQTMIFILHSIFANFNTLSLYLRQKSILDLVKIKEDHFSGFTKKSLVMKNYMTCDAQFQLFLSKWGTLTFIVHLFSVVLLPLMYFLFSGKCLIVTD